MAGEGSHPGWQWSPRVPSGCQRSFGRDQIRDIPKALMFADARPTPKQALQEWGTVVHEPGASCTPDAREVQDGHCFVSP